MFYELAQPYFSAVDGKWLILTKETVQQFGFGYLDTDGIVRSISGMDKTRCFYDTVELAHVAGILYYHLHGKVYPYQEAISTVNNEKVKQPTTIQSEVMEF